MQFITEFIATPVGLLTAFVATAAVVVLAGIRLSIYGDALGDRTGLGNGLIGLVFLAGVTSLPELVVSLTSVINATEPSQGADMATGNMLGSNVFNLLILAVMALLFPGKFKPAEMKDSHTDSTIYGVMLLALFSGAYLAAGTPWGNALIPGLRCTWPVLSLPIAYAFILRREHRQHKLESDEQLPRETELTKLPALRFYSTLGALCAFILGGGILLSILGSRMALPPDQGGFGLEASLIGTIFLAISTSLPELVISFASIRMGFLDMAAGNVLGSNMFNLLIIFAADVTMRGGSLLQHISTKHWSTVGVILLLTVLASALLRSKTRRASTRIAIGMLGLYVCVIVFLM